MKKIIIIFSIFLGVVILLGAGSALAVTLGFDTVSQDVMLGDLVDVDLFISGLEDSTAPSLSAFDLDIIYDPTILSMADVTFGDQLDIWGLGWNPMGVSTVSSGVENIWEISFDWPWDLDDLQAGSFTLATLTFDTLALGTSNLDLSINALGDALGDPLVATTQSGNINVVPEPATIVLLGSGLAGIGFFRRKKVL